MIILAIRNEIEEGTEQDFSSILQRNSSFSTPSSYTLLQMWHEMLPSISDLITPVK